MIDDPIELRDKEKKQLSSAPNPADLDFLLEHYGIDNNYIDYSGNTLTIPYDHRLRVLSLMGIATDSSISISNAISAIKESVYFSLLPPVSIFQSAEHLKSNPDNSSPNKLTNSIEINIPEVYLDVLMEWEIVLENGDFLSSTFNLKNLTEILFEKKDEPKNITNASTGKGGTDSIRMSKRIVSLPTLPEGYHLLKIRPSKLQPVLKEELFNHFFDDTNTLCSLIVSPKRCYEPQWILDNKKLGGISTQVYSLRSEDDWGMGDFSDLKSLISHLKPYSIDFIVLNPLHLLDADNPTHCSPYSPMDRRYLNPLYIDPKVEPDFIDSDFIQKYLGKESTKKRLKTLRSSDLIDYESVSTLKYYIFSKMFSYFNKHHLKKSTDRGQQFKSYTEKKGYPGLNFSEHQAKKNRFSFKQSRNPKFHLYLQWIAEYQLESCQQLSKENGMSVGLIRDLAVGSNSNSAEVELNENLFCTDASIGAPPDPLAPQGQNWGLPPMKPCVLKQTGYSHFIDLLFSNMIHCGALRIDHVMALMRLWWCPAYSQQQNGEGAYVHYPVDALFAILRLESQRNKCMVIGEDLGVVPPEIHQHMTNSAVFSNVLFYFEKYDHTHFKKPEHIAQKSLSMIANHDVPTLTAWWNKSDITIRKEIGLFSTDEEFNSAIRARESDLIQILHWLNEQHLLPSQWNDFNIHRKFNRELSIAILEANSRSSAQLVSTQIDDLCMLELPVNIPGTSDEYPNWRRKLPYTINALFADLDVQKSISVFGHSRST